MTFNISAAHDATNSLAMARWHQKGEWFRLTCDSVQFLQVRFASQFDSHLLEEIGVSNG